MIRHWRQQNCDLRGAGTVLAVELVSRLAPERDPTMGALWIHPESHTGPEQRARLGSSPSQWGLLTTEGEVGKGWRGGVHSEALALRRVMGGTSGLQVEQLGREASLLLRRRKPWPGVLS